MALDAGLRRSDVIAVAREGRRVALAAAARDRMLRSREAVRAASKSVDPIYGVSTGFGALAATKIPAARRRDLQHALVRSHAAGMGSPVEDEVVRAMMLLRARTLARGYSGVRPLVAEALLALVNAGVTPVVPEYGSLGCSGDLAPLAHVALCLIGEGSARDRAGSMLERLAPLTAAGLDPLELVEKEGLALLNGTDGTLGMLVLACEDARHAIQIAEIAASMSIEALCGNANPYAAALQELRPHPGQAASAANMRRLLAGSQLIGSHAVVQDAYSVRCAPQVAGAARDALEFACTVADRELASAIDNPVVLEDGGIESTGNFHGAPLGYACDLLAMVTADLGSISERRVDRLLDVTRSRGLPAFLAEEPGVDSGFMIAQYTAAALVADCKLLAQPASVDTIPTSAMQEDHVSMAWGAARKLRRAVDLLESILAIEITCAARAIDMRAPVRPGAGTGAVRDLVRAYVPGVGPDRPVAPDLALVKQLVHSRRLVGAAATAVGGLQ